MRRTRTRPLPRSYPFDGQRAETFLAHLEGGGGFDDALAVAGLTEKAVREWLRRACLKGAAGDRYRQLQARVTRLIAATLPPRVRAREGLR
jgi:hypothetical protein